MNQFDVLAELRERVETFEFAVGIGYYANDDDAETCAGSASVLNTPTGVN